jgi:hypothetical protein
MPHHILGSYLAQNGFIAKENPSTSVIAQALFGMYALIADAPGP